LTREICVPLDDVPGRPGLQSARYVQLLRMQMSFGQQNFVIPRIRWMQQSVIYSAWQQLVYERVEAEVQKTFVSNVIRHCCCFLEIVVPSTDIKT